MTIDDLAADLRTTHDQALMDSRAWEKRLRVQSGHKLPNAVSLYIQALAATETAKAAREWIASEYHDVGDLDLPTARLLVRTLIARLTKP